MKWPVERLGKLAQFRNGLNFTKSNFGQGLKVVNVKDFKDRFKAEYAELEEIDPVGLVSDDELLIDQDILFVRSNGNRALVGRTLFVEQPPEPVSFSAFAIRVRFQDHQVLPRFYAYYFRSPSFRQFLSLQGAGTNICNLNQKVLGDLIVPFPPLSTQRCITDFLSTYDDLIENNLRRIALLEESARLLYREWFVRLRFPGHEHTRIINGVPEGWHRMELQEIAEEIREQIAPDKVEADTPYIGLEHMPRRSLALSTWGSASEVQSAKHIFKERDILFGKIRPYFHKVGVCFTDGIASTDAIVIRPGDESIYGLVLMTVSSDEFVAHANQSSYGAKMPRADWKVLKKYWVNVPPPGLRKQFSESVDCIVSLLKSLTYQNQKLKRARDLLLPRLMRGEIAV